MRSSYFFQRRIVFALSLVGCIGAISASGQEKDIFEALDWGKHTVGFRSQFMLDHSRIYAAKFDQGGAYGVDKPAPRPILVNIWYPATQGDHSPINYGRYFELETPNKDLGQWVQGLSSYAKDVVTSELFGKPVSDLDELEVRLWNRFLRLPTRAALNTKPAEGSFPVVVYHSGSGSSYEDNSVFCEFLASNGFVVLGSAYPSTDGSGYGIDGGDGSVRDMEFLSRLANELEFADWSKMAYAGHSAGAQTSLRAATRPDCPANTIVLLDTTVDYYSVHVPTFQYITKLAIEHARHVDESMLVATGPEALFQMCDRLVESERTYLTTPELGHNEFIAQGIWRLQVIQWLNEGRPDEKYKSDLERFTTVRDNYIRLCHITCDFLKSKLLNESDSFQSQAAKLSGIPLDRNQFGIQVIARGESQPTAWPIDSPTPPNPRQLLGIIDQHGVDKFCEVYEKFHDTHSDSPIYESSMLVCSLLCELMQQQRLDDAQKLHQTTKRLGADGVSTLRFLAFMSELTKKIDWERNYLEMAMAIDPNDKTTKEKMDAFKKRTDSEQ